MLLPNHDLTAWAQQRLAAQCPFDCAPAGMANGHAGQIWEPFTDAIIRVVNHQEQLGLLFILWGACKFARKNP